MHGPGACQPEVGAGTLLRKREVDEIGLPRVEFRARLVPLAQPHLDLDPRIPGQGADQIDVEARRSPVRIQVFEGREVRITAVDEPARGLRFFRAEPRRDRGDGGGEEKQGKSSHHS